MATHSRILAWKIHGQRTQRATSPQGHKESDTTKRLSTHARKEIKEINKELVSKTACGPQSLKYLLLHRPLQKIFQPCTGAHEPTQGTFDLVPDIGYQRFKSKSHSREGRYLISTILLCDPSLQSHF